MAADRGNSNLTKKGTKQRSFNLDDPTFAIVEREAERLHVTNSAALSMILNGWADEGLPAAPAEVGPARSQTDARDLSYLLPSSTATEFTVADPEKPLVKRTRSKLDDKLSDESDILRSPKDD